jgi:hypothetical protein
MFLLLLLVHVYKAEGIARRNVSVLKKIPMQTLFYKYLYLIQIKLHKLYSFIDQLITLSHFDLYVQRYQH